MRQQLHSELDEVFPLSHKVQLFCDVFCQKNEMFALDLLVLLYSDRSQLQSKPIFLFLHFIYNSQRF